MDDDGRSTLWNHSVSSAKVGGKEIVLVAGDRDSYCPKRAITELAESLGAQLRIIEGGTRMDAIHSNLKTRRVDASKRCRGGDSQARKRSRRGEWSKRRQSPHIC